MRVNLSHVVEVTKVRDEHTAKRIPVHYGPMWDPLYTFVNVSLTGLSTLTHLHIREFLSLVKQGIHCELARKIIQPPEREAFRWSISDDTEYILQIHEVFSDARDIKGRGLSCHEWMRFREAWTRQEYSHHPRRCTPGTRPFRRGQSASCRDSESHTVRIRSLHPLGLSHYD